MRSSKAPPPRRLVTRLRAIRQGRSRPAPPRDHGVAAQFLDHITDKEQHRAPDELPNDALDTYRMLSKAGFCEHLDPRAAATTQATTYAASPWAGLHAELNALFGTSAVGTRIPRTRARPPPLAGRTPPTIRPWIPGYGTAWGRQMARGLRSPPAPRVRRIPSPARFACLDLLVGFTLCRIRQSLRPLKELVRWLRGRPRLEGWLDEGLARGLILVCAPAVGGLAVAGRRRQRSGGLAVVIALRRC
jgi:hypothetical protein